MIPKIKWRSLEAGWIYSVTQAGDDAAKIGPSGRLRLSVVPVRSSLGMWFWFVTWLDARGRRARLWSAAQAFTVTDSERGELQRLAGIAAGFEEDRHRMLRSVIRDLLKSAHAQTEIETADLEAGVAVRRQ